MGIRDRRSTCSLATSCPLATCPASRPACCWVSASAPQGALRRYPKLSQPINRGLSQQLWLARAAFEHRYFGSDIAMVRPALLAAAAPHGVGLASSAAAVQALILLTLHCTNSTCRQSMIFRSQTSAT